MRSELLQLVRAFGSIDVLVLGEAMLDSYLLGSADRLCREAPVPVLAVSEQVDQAGGAANTAVNAAALGAHTSFLGVVGNDEAARRLRRALEAAGVSPEDLVVASGRETLSKTRLASGGQLIARVDRGDTGPLPREVERQLIARLEALHAAVDLVIVSDYGYGTVTPQVVSALAELQARDEKVLVVDSKYPERFRELNAAAVKPNYGEVVRLLGLESRQAGRIEQIAEHEERLLELTGARVVASTMDEEGALVFERGAHPYRTWAQPVPHSNATGAGDTFTAALGLALTAGAGAPLAAECASAAARVVVSREGTSACTSDDLLGLFAGDEKLLLSRHDLAALAARLRESGKRIVFTNGCFDILHRGHVTYLSRAKALGDVLMVAVNADEQVRAQKGPGRPINPLEDRIGVLSALSCIDFVIPFEEPTPRELIALVRPDVFVKGGDYTHESLPEAPLVRQLGGRVELLPYLDGRSTTGIIRKAGESLPRRRAAAGGGPA